MTRAERLAVVTQFADTALASARDTIGPEQTPLFVDGLETETRAPVRWRHDGEEWVLANPASQQILYRSLVGLSALTGDPRYRQAAVDAMRFVFARFPRSCGLLQWGGHCLWDAAGDRFVGEGDKHELKCNYPFYEFMWEIDPAATARYVEAFWNAHILDWGNLDENRHGAFDQPLGRLWENEYNGGPPFFVGKGLTFINCGSDLVLAGATLYHYRGDAGALTWAKRMAQRYVEARNPETGLGAYQYSQIAKDRALVQFGPEFGDRLLEGTMLDTGRALTIYARAGLVWLRLAERLGVAGAEFLHWATDGLAAYARWAYDPASNTCFAVITDGTRLTPADMKREGYYGPATLSPRPAGGPLLLSYALGARLTGDDLLWQTARSIARGNDLGDLGTRPGEGVQLNRQTAHAEATSLLGVLEVWRATGSGAYLELAEAIGDNLVSKHYRDGLFVMSDAHRYTRVDALEPLALLALEAALRGKPERVPEYTGGTANFTCPYDGVGRRQENDLIYAQTR